MANAENPSVARFAIKGVLGTEEVVNTVHLARPAGAPWTAALMAEAAQALYDTYEAQFLPVLSTSYELVRVDGVQQAGPGSLLGSYTDGSRPNGQVTGDCLPYNCSVCLTWRTGLSGRSYIGRMYMPGIAETSQNESRLTTAAAGAFNSAAEAFRLALNVAGFVPGVFSRFANKAERDVGLFTPATSFTLTNNVIDSQRSRTPR